MCCRRSLLRALARCCCYHRYGERHGDQFMKRAQADSFRSKLLIHASNGVAFDLETGLPVPMLEERQAACTTPSWYEHAVEYASRQWPGVSAKQRASIADALATVTLVLTRSEEGRPDPATMRRVLSGWAFNVNARIAIQRVGLRDDR
jgi:hypothetical protein